MNTTAHTHHADHAVARENTETKNWWLRMEEAAEFNRYAIISVGFLIIGIVGGAVVGLFAHSAIWQIATIVGFTMASLTLMLAVAPMKYILRTTAAALLVDLIMVVINVI